MITATRRDGMMTGTVARQARPFVGRTQELAVLGDALARAQAGSGSVWLLVGEPGIGKSRLAEELAARAEASGCWVAFGRAWESGGAPAFWPWTQVLRGLLRRGDVDDIAASRREWLAPLLPELAGDDRTARAEPAPEAARFRLLDAAVGALLDLAERAPLCVVLEDLHAADHASLLLLELLAPQLRSAPLLVIGTHRELAGDDLARLGRSVCTLPLGRLSRAEVADYLVRVHEQVAAPAWIDVIAQRSEGNPLLLVELARRPDDTLARGDAVPASVRAAVRQRLAGASPEARALVEFAAVLGRELSVPLLAAGLGHAPAVVAALLDELAPAGVIDTVDDGVLRFSHALVRDALYAGLAPEHRAALHARAAEACLRGAAGAEPPFSALAHHLLRAPESERDRAIEAAVCAAEVALAGYAFADAAQWLGQALAHLDGGAGADPRRRAELLVSLGRATILAGRLAEGRARCAEAAAAARALGATGLLARAALEYGATFVIADVDDTLVALLREAQAAMPADEVALRARVGARLAAALQPAADPEGPIAMAREALALARAHGDPATLLDVLRSAGSALADLGDPAERRALDGEHLALAVGVGDVAETVRAAIRATFDALELGEIADARAQLRIADEAAARLGVPHAQWRAALARAALEACVGDRAAFDEARHRGAVLAEQAGDPNARRCLAQQALVAAWWFGARAQLDEALPEALASLSRTEVVMGYGALLQAFVEAQGGRAPQVRLPPATVQRLLDTPDMSLWSLFAEVVLHRGARELGAALCERMAAHVHRFANFGMSAAMVTAPMGLWRGRLLAMIGQRDAAVRELEAAWVLAERAGAAPAQARLAEALAELSGRAPMPAHNAARAVAPAAAAPASTALRVRRLGDIWELHWAAAPVVHVRDTKGMAMLATLVAAPGRAFHVLELVGEHVPGDAGPLLDATAREAYRARLAELDEVLEQAQAWHDLARTERLIAERDALHAELARGVGLGGRLRVAGSSSERARINVQRRLKDVVRRVASADAELGRHLERALRTGTYCSYEP